jgi:hypothetical protein
MILQALLESWSGSYSVVEPGVTIERREMGML